MASYTRLGSYLLANELATVPFGKVHRGLTLQGSSLERHHLVCTFSDEIIDAGLAAKMDEVTRVAGLLAGTRGFGANYHSVGGRAPHLSCEYIPGRSLAQLLEKTKVEQIPLGVDHALSVLQGVAQSLVQLHGKGLHHGVLSPHSVWVSFEGATTLLDAPQAAILQSLLPKCPAAAAALERYRPTTPASALHQDFYALGAMLYELLTLDKLPSQDLVATAIQQAGLKAAQEDGPAPAEIQGLLRRLLMVEAPFENAAAFGSELERVLYDGDYSPTTFNMAFFMHTLFREENDHDLQAIKADQSADFTPFLANDAENRGIFETQDGRPMGKFFAIGGGVVAVIVGLLGYSVYERGVEAKRLQKMVAELQTQQQQNEARLTDLDRQEALQKAKQSDLEKKAGEAKTAEEKKKLQQQLEEAKKQQADLQKQKEEELRKQQEIKQRTQAMAQATQPAKAEPKPVDPPKVAQVTPPPPAPVAQPTTPPPPPVQTPAPQPQAPAPQAQAPLTAAPAKVASSGVEIPAKVLKQAQPTFPSMAYQTISKRLQPNIDRAVQLRVFVDANGKPQKVVTVEGVPGSMGFDEAARDAAMASTFSAAMKDGRSTSGWVEIRYSFPKIKTQR